MYMSYNSMIRLKKKKTKWRKNFSMKRNLLREVDSEERDPPPVVAIEKAHIGEPPILFCTPLPVFSPQIVMAQPHTPNPSQQYHNPWSPPITLSPWMTCIVMNQHHRYHRPVQVNHLHHVTHISSHSTKTLTFEAKSKTIHVK